MTRTWTHVLFFFIAANGYSHSGSDSIQIQFGTFRAEVRPDAGLPWTEITFFPGKLDLFVMKNMQAQCEDMFGHGAYLQSGDTLILRDFISWSTQGCKTELTENMIVPEKRYLIRRRGIKRMELALIQGGQGQKLNWTGLRILH